MTSPIATSDRIRIRRRLDQHQIATPPPLPPSPLTTSPTSPPLITLTIIHLSIRKRSVSTLISRTLRRFLRMCLCKTFLRSLRSRSLRRVSRNRRTKLSHALCWLPAIPEVLRSLHFLPGFTSFSRVTFFFSRENPDRPIEGEAPLSCGESQPEPRRGAHRDRDGGEGERRGGR